MPWLIVIPFAMTVVIHLLTFLGLRLSNGAQGAVIVSLALASILASGAMTFKLRSTSSDSDLPTDRKSNPWVLCLMICLTIYAGVNFFVCLRLMEFGAPTRTATGYILTDHGTIIRPLTEGEYWKMVAYQLRLFTGHFLVFLGWPMVYFFRRSVQEPGPERA